MLIFNLPALRLFLRWSFTASRSLRDIINKTSTPFAQPDDTSTPSVSSKTKAKASLASKSSVPRYRAPGLSKTARVPSLHQFINPAPKRLEKAPEKKVPKRKGDLDEEDFSEGEWAEMEKERKKREENMVWGDFD
jgi:hypothetical protein